MNQTHELLIGLEIHVQLDVSRKLFTPTFCKKNEAANFEIGAFDAGYPGSFARLNLQALNHAVFLGFYCQARLASSLEFDRKHFFFPDNPKGYQITQIHRPLFTKGFFYSPSCACKIPLEKILLEEAMATLYDLTNATGIDMNTSGDALIEITTAPCFKTSKDAALCVQDLQSFLFKAKLTQEPLRIDLNISLGSYLLEIKNLHTWECFDEATKQGLVYLQKLKSASTSHRLHTGIFDPTKRRLLKTFPKLDANKVLSIPEPDVGPFLLDPLIFSKIQARAAQFKELY